MHLIAKQKLPPLARPIYVQVMELYAKHRAVLELEYFNEVGTGLGPTLEFYTMLSHELQKKSLGMWRHEEPPEQQPSAADDEAQQQAAADGVNGQASNAGVQPKQHPAGGRSDVGGPSSTPSSRSSSRHGSRPSSRGGAAPDGVAVPSVQLHQEVISHEQATATAAEYVYAPHGLFPVPLKQQQRAAGTSVVEYFRLLGRAVAKALQDNRLLDLPLNPVFFKAALGKPLDIYDVAKVDPVLGSSLERLAKSAAAHAAAGGKGAVMVDGCSIDDLCLSFTLPGMLHSSDRSCECLLAQCTTCPVMYVVGRTFSVSLLLWPDRITDADVVLVLRLHVSHRAAVQLRLCAQLILQVTPPMSCVLVVLMWWSTAAIWWSTSRQLSMPHWVQALLLN